MEEIKSVIPKYVKKIMDKLEKEGFKSYIVGGCIRDVLLNKNPKDWDVITNAKPCDAKKIFDRYTEFGFKYGTTVVYIGSQKCEVTTFRTESNYIDFRHPENVFFTNSLKEDLKRRDFTMNAIAYNQKNGFIDVFSGMEHIKQKIIKTCGNASNKLFEDSLRMLRAIRFACQTGFDLDEEIINAIKKGSNLVQKISVAVIREEFEKMLLSDYPQKIKLLAKTGLDEYIVPGFSECFRTDQNSKYHIYNVGDHTMKVLENIEPNLNLRLAALLHDFGKTKAKKINEEGAVHFNGHENFSCQMADEIMAKLGYGTKTIRKVLKLIKFHDCLPKVNFESIKNMVHLVGGQCQFRKIMKLQKADSHAKNLKYYPKKLKYIEQIENILNTCY